MTDLTSPDTEYSFSDTELKTLAVMFSQSPVPKGLEKLYRFALSYVYQTMTIAEAEKLIAGEH